EISVGHDLPRQQARVDLASRVLQLDDADTTSVLVTLTDWSNGQVRCIHCCGQELLGMPAELVETAAFRPASGIEDRKPERVRLAAHVRGEAVHVRRRQFRLPPRAAQTRVAFGIIAVDEHGTPADDTVPAHRLERCVWPDLRIEHRERGAIAIARQPLHPLVERPRLPPRAISKARGDLRRRRYADRVEVVTPDAGKPEFIKLTDERRLA